ncbi:hypothetical protein BCY91_07675 [Pelobium manganitolerans]|uniref:Seryl-tRNA synthetase n=1 Tax=Pelobium manganitolerans TaxID=1842495 RepID=A0A419S3X6_9SPHI|nr:hypothetical protein [Pelobium manganitolerans]RKD14357.1 hypothetical protein BCY91_07675 [Pelobium manganitolerans]
MKKLIYFAFSLLMLVASTNFASATEKTDKALSAAQQAKLEQLTNRVEQIRSMDKSHMSRAEKKELRAELRQMKKEANAIGNGGIYLSVTALLVIIIVLLIL